MDKKKSRREFIEMGSKAGVALPLLSSRLWEMNFFLLYIYI